MTFRFAVDDVMNTYVRELVIDAPNETEARRCAISWLFARRSPEQVELTLQGPGDG